MNRRRFLFVAAGMGATMIQPVRWLASRAAVRRVVRALRGGRYPGRVTDLVDAQVRRPGRWGG